MSQNEFFQNIEIRLNKYPNLLTQSNDWQMQNAILQAVMCIVNEMKSHFIRFKTEDGDFWGYGINSVSDGKEKNTNLDVEIIKYAEPLNRHHNPKCCILAFMLFKIKDYQFHYKVFSINVPRAKMNTDVGNIPLNLLESTKLKTRQNPDLPSIPGVYLELNFLNKELPVSFQIDPMINAQDVGLKYKEKIEEFAKIAKSMEEESRRSETTNFFGDIKGNVHTGKGDINSYNGNTGNDKVENSNIIIALIVLDLIALVLASIWAFKSKWDFEPIILILGFAGGLIALLIKKSKK